MNSDDLFLRLAKKSGSFKEKELKVELYADHDDIPVISGLIHKEDEEGNVIEDFRTMFRFIDNRWMEFPNGEERVDLAKVSKLQIFYDKSIELFVETVDEFKEYAKKRIDELEKE